MRYPLLSFIELQRLSKLLSNAIAGARVDRVFIPECVEHPQGFFKNEIVLELYSGSSTFQLLLSLRPQACGIIFLTGKTLRPSKTATHSGFDLGLHKNVEGLRIDSVTSLPNERILQIRFQGSGDLSLFLSFIPAQPKGILCTPKEFVVPEARALTPEQLAKIPDRPELLTSLAHYSQLWQSARAAEALGIHKQKLVAALENQAQSFSRKLRSLGEQLEQSKTAPDWNYYGSLLQTHFHSKPVLTNGHYSFMDYEKEENVLIPGDVKLNAKQQLEKYFHQAKRNRTRLLETTSRMKAVQEKLELIEKDLVRIRAATDLSSEVVSTAPDKDASKKLSSYAGKTYRSQEGLTILSGRSKDENLELTFKIARGNDIWLHVKGRPGSHTIILLPPKRSASLDTLLDAATLCILHSGGKDWGKTEVDYTQRKFVKKIKNQTDVSYSGNKTLAVTIEPERLKRLYGELPTKQIC